MLNHPYRKKWGQNFIKDNNIIKKIINVVSPNKNDNIIEIGPGRGALTSCLLNTKRLSVVEIDPILCSYLKKKFNDKLKIINQDILNLKLDNFNGYNKKT